MTALVIENCEAALSEWLFLEYKHAAEMGNAVFTNVVEVEKNKLKLSNI